MEKRFVLFFALSLAVFMGHAALMRWIYGPPKPRVNQEEVADQDRADEPATGKPAAPKGKSPAAAAIEKPADHEPENETALSDNAEGGETIAAKHPPEDGAADKEVPAGKKDTPAAKKEVVKQDVETQYIAIGSADDDSPYRMLVIFVNTGAAIESVELNNPRYLDLEYRAGYLGSLSPMNDPRQPGVLVRVVGQGTPAAKAGMKPGDVIVSLDGDDIPDVASLVERLSHTRPKQTVEVVVLRGARRTTLSAKLVRKPLAVIQPEGDAPPSLLLSLARLDDDEFQQAEENDVEIEEISGAGLRKVNWEVVSQTAEEVVFRHLVSRSHLEVVKRFRLARKTDDAAPRYHLDVDVEIRNRDGAEHRVAYALDGPNGLPTEGWWYASKIGRSWGGIGLRDIALGQRKGDYIDDTLFSCQKVADGKSFTPNPDLTLSYLGVDAQYFSAILIPQKKDSADVWFDDYRALRVTPPPSAAKKRLTNTSFRLISTVVPLAADGPGLAHHYRFFVGPKKPDLLAHYHLDGLIYYGWFSVVSRPMLSVLHFFHRYLTFGNYGLAILLLTIVVRSGMFPLSRKQALNAQKMQELQPELKRLSEKYKKDLEKRTKAQQDLFRKHNYNPMGGCLVMFIQLPIFIGLYRSLMVDIELRQAPLISEGIRWCSNLSAPDMLWNWSDTMPSLVTGWLGPYLNVLPLITVLLFLWQQKMFMPPATDDQSRMQQQMMKFMMLFMGFMFFKVASGLCLYFIASSIWGITERKILPKTSAQSSSPPAAAPAKTPAVKPASGGNGAARSAGRKKQKGRR